MVSARSLALLALLAAACRTTGATPGAPPPAPEEVLAELSSEQDPARFAERAWIEANRRDLARARLDRAILEQPTAELLLVRSLLSLVELDNGGARADWLRLLREHPASAEAELALLFQYELLPQHLARRAEIRRALEGSAVLLPCPRGQSPACGSGWASRVALAAALLARLDVVDRQEQAAQEHLLRGGWLGRWTVAGPLAPRARASLSEPSAPELTRAAAPTPAFRGQTPPVREVRADGHAVEPATGDQEGLYLLETYFELGRDPSATPLALELHLQDPARIAVDGTVVHRLAAGDPRARGLARVELSLEPGWHRLSIAVLATGSSRVAASLLAADGRAVLLHSQAAPPSAPLARGPPVVAQAQQGEGDPQSVEAMLSRLSHGPGASFGLYLEGMAALSGWRDEPDRARRALTLAGEARPRSAALLHARVRLIGKTGLPPSLGQARERDALEQDPKLPVALATLAHSISDEQPDAALALAERAEQAAPQAAEPHELRFWIYRTRSWTAEAHASLLRALELGPSEQLLSQGADYARGLLRLEEAAGMEQQALALSERPAAREAEIALRRGDADAAIDAHRRDARPGRADPLVRAAELELGRGRAHQAAELALEALALDPLHTQALRALAAARAAEGDPSAAAAALRRLRKAGTTDTAVEARLAELEGRSLGAPPAGVEAVDVAALLAHAREDEERWAGHSLVRLLDRAVDRVELDGSALSVRHTITRLLTKEATDQAGEISVPQSALLLALRTLKSDGRVIEVDRHAGKDDLSFSALAIGDAVEGQWATLETPATPWGGYLRSFYFQGPSPVAAADYVVQVPRAMAVRWWLRNGAPEPQVIEDGERRIYHFRARDVAAIEPEPSSVDDDEYLPAVVFAAGVDEELARRANALPVENLAAGGWEIQRRAEALTATAGSDEEKLEELFAWVSTAIAHGEARDPAVVLALGRGDRTGLFLATARAAGLDARLALARPGNAPPTMGPDLSAFRSPLVRVRLPRRTVWVALGLPDPWIGKAPPEMRGGSYLLVGDTGAEVLPFAEEEVERWSLTSEASLQVDGAGTAQGSLRVSIPGGWAAELREFLLRSRREDVGRALESWTAQVLPGAQVLDFHTENATQPLLPLVLEVSVQVPSFMVAERGRLVAEQFFGGTIAGKALGFPPLSGYLMLPERKTPLLLGEQIEDCRITVRLPEGSGAPEEAPKSFSRQSGYGSFSQRFDYQSASRTVKLELHQSLPQRRVAPAAFSELRGFFQEVLQSTRNRLVVPYPQHASQSAASPRN